MSKVTEDEVIEFLQERIEKLNKELRKTHAALAALTGAHTDEEHAPSKKERKVIKAAKKEIRKSKPADNGVGLAIPQTYDSKARLQDKIAYALWQTGPAFKDDLVKKLYELEPAADLNKLDKSISLKLSLLYQSGILKAEKVGKKYRYTF